MKPPRKRQYTIRAVPAEVDRTLRRRARANGQSLNQAVVEALRRGAGLDGSGPVHTDLDEFFGAAKPDSQIDRVLAEQRRMDPDLSRI